MQNRIVLKITEDKDTKTRHFAWSWLHDNDEQGYEAVLKAIDEEIAIMQKDIDNLNHVERVLKGKRNDLKEMKEFRELIADEIKKANVQNKEQNND